MMTWVRCTAFLIVACALLCARTAFAEASGSNTANALTRDAMRGDVDNDFALERVTVDTRGKIIITIDRDRELIATFVIRNDNGFDIKDTEIVCTHFGISGTQIDSNTRTIYELVPARSWRQVRDINMGSVRDQITRTSCRVTKLIPIMVDPVARERETKEAEAQRQAWATEAAAAQARKKEEEANKAEEDEVRRKEDEALSNCRITPEQFSTLQTGMSYVTAERALNCRGRRISKTVYRGGLLVTVYGWKLDGSDADASATFQNGRLKSKQIDR